MLPLRARSPLKEVNEGVQSRPDMSGRPESGDVTQGLARMMVLRSPVPPRHTFMVARQFLWLPDP